MEFIVGVKSNKAKNDMKGGQNSIRRAQSYWKSFLLDQLKFQTPKKVGENQWNFLWA